MLYEVITDIADGQGILNADAEHLPQVQTLIQLGKNAAVDGNPAKMLHRVITSYSIHYTKLYEIPLSFSLAAVLPRRGT